VKIAVFGIGNVLAQDDAVGPSVARLLEAQYAFPEGVVVEDLGTPALELPTHLAGYDRVIFIDAVKDSTAAAGTVKIYDRDAILRHPPGLRLSPHDPALKETLMMLELIGEAPGDVTLVGIVAKDAQMGIGLSPEVTAALEPAVDAVVAELERIGVFITRKETPDLVDLWWAA
jgi:hydrogenase maturation protease